MMFRDACIECICRNRILALQQAEIISRHKQVQETALLADAAVAFSCLDNGWCVDFEFHRTAVTAARMYCHSLTPSAIQQYDCWPASRKGCFELARVARQMRRDPPGHVCHFQGRVHTAPDETRHYSLY